MEIEYIIQKTVSMARPIRTVRALFLYCLGER